MTDARPCSSPCRARSVRSREGVREPPAAPAEARSQADRATGTRSGRRRHDLMIGWLASHGRTMHYLLEFIASRLKHHSLLRGPGLVGLPASSRRPTLHLTRLPTLRADHFADPAGSAHFKDTAFRGNNRADNATRGLRLGDVHALPQIVARVDLGLILRRRATVRRRRHGTLLQVRRSSCPTTAPRG